MTKMNLENERKAMSMALHNLCVRNNITPCDMIENMKQANKEFKKNVEQLKKDIKMKLTNGRGGKRQGAGRPVGTTKENTKKMYSFRLSPEEEKAVRELLKQMRNR